MLGENSHIPKTEQLRKAAFWGDFADQAAPESVVETNANNVNAVETESTVEELISTEDHAIKVIQRAFRLAQKIRNERKQAKSLQQQKEEELYFKNLTHVEVTLTP